MVKAQKKVQKKVEVKGSSEGKSDEGLMSEVEILGRRRLLAELAGSVAGGIFASSSEPPSTAAEVAEIAVDVAEAILQKVGL